MNDFSADISEITLELRNAEITHLKPFFGLFILSKSFLWNSPLLPYSSQSLILLSFSENDNGEKSSLIS